MSNTTFSVDPTTTYPATILFHGHELVTIHHQGDVYAAMKSICEALGLQWEAQLKRIKRNPILFEGAVIMTVPSKGGAQETIFLPLRLLNGWLFGIDTRRVKPEIREAVLTYQRECYDVLYRHWHGHARPQPSLPSINVSGFQDDRYLLRVVDGCLLMTRLNEEQTLYTRKEFIERLEWEGWALVKKEALVQFKDDALAVAGTAMLLFYESEAAKD